MTSWHSYPKVYALGHPELDDLFNGTVYVQEKVDGSQFSFGKFDGVLHFRSKGQEIYDGAVPQMFARAVAAVKAREADLMPNWTYRGEVLDKPKHNVLAYDRTPKDNIIIFDVNLDEERYTTPDQTKGIAAAIGFECVPFLDTLQAAPSMDWLHKMLERVSVLGGQKIEGVVFKNYTQFGRDKKALMGKFVSEAFKEVHAGEWKKANPVTGDVVELLGQQYRTPARWEKAIQHLDEAGRLQHAPQDIGPLIGEVVDDVKAECEEEIKAALFKYAWPRMARQLTAGLPEWYKERLASSVLE